MNMLIAIALLALGFVALIKGADWLVDGASGLARRYHISELVIGLTIVAFGTSAPELIVNVLSSVNGYNGVAYGNVIGSNIFNLMLILGVAGVIYPISVQRQTIRYEIPISLAAAVLLYILVNEPFTASAPVLSRLDAGILLVAFALFLVYIFVNMKAEEMPAAPATPTLSLTKSLVFIVAGLGGLILGGKLVVDNAVTLAAALGMSEKLIGLTIVAVGTSLPELATSVVASIKKNSDIAIGNVVGSNIFNILFILGVSGAIAPIPYDPVLNTDIWLLLAGTVLLIIFMFTLKRKMLDRWEAVLMIVIYIGYVVFLIYRN